MRQFFSFAFLSAISYLCHRVFDKSKWNTKDTAFKVDKSLPRLLPYAVCQIVRFDWNFCHQKVAPKPSACRFRGNNLRPALSGRSKNKTMQPPAPGTRAVGCSFSAASENADFSRRVSRRTTPAWQKRRSKRCGLKARAEGTVCLQTRE